MCSVSSFKVLTQLFALMTTVGSVSISKLLSQRQFLQLHMSQATPVVDSYFVDINNLLAFRNNDATLRAQFPNIKYNILWKARNQILNKTNYSVTNKTSIPPSNASNDYMSQQVYAYHPQELLENPKIGKCYQCVRLELTNPSYFKKVCDEKTKKIKSLNTNPDKYALQNLVMGAYLLKDKTTFSSTKYTYFHYVDEAIRLINQQYADPITKMNPNMKYCQMVPSVPYGGNASQMYFEVGQEGTGFGIEDFSSKVMYLVEAINLLEQLSKIQTDMSTTQQEGIANAVQSMRKWMQEFLDWSLTSLQGQDARNQANNHGSWFLVLYGSFSHFTKNATHLTNFRTFVDMMGDNNTLNFIYLTNSMNEQIKDQYPSFYTQFGANGTQPLEAYYVGLLADKTGATIKGQSFWRFKTSGNYSVGIEDSLDYLWYKYQNDLFASSQDIDYRNLGDLFYEYDRIPTYKSTQVNLNLRARGDQIYTEKAQIDQTKEKLSYIYNETSMNASSVLCLNGVYP
ncbi:exported protein [Stylonychia lemnae]|uniref:Exported protein n=1 Tax=Stylonychia lemnae TaxID=5949 RepID=A0A078ABT8_STYLE|nr:exported protein [Stylonychia lemnae]|eukprot:CDW79654.1 exported protein [Stylonychia lemnae]